jgi:hypothetical protein
VERDIRQRLQQTVEQALVDRRGAVDDLAQARGVVGRELRVLDQALEHGWNHEREGRALARDRVLDPGADQDGRETRGAIRDLAPALTALAEHSGLGAGRLPQLAMQALGELKVHIVLPVAGDLPWRDDMKPAGRFIIVRKSHRSSRGRPRR